MNILDLATVYCEVNGNDNMTISHHEYTGKTIIHMSVEDMVDIEIHLTRKHHMKLVRYLREYLRGGHVKARIQCVKADEDFLHITKNNGSLTFEIESGGMWDGHVEVAAYNIYEILDALDISERRRAVA